MDVKNEPEELGQISVTEGEWTDTPEPVNLFEGDPPGLEIFVDKEEPIDEEYEVKDFLSGNNAPNKEDPSKICVKVEIKQEDFESDEKVDCSTPDNTLEVLTIKMEIKNKPEELSEISVMGGEGTFAGNSSEEDCSDDFLCVQCRVSCRLKDVTLNRKVDPFCSDCYVVLRKEAFEEWMKKMHSELDSCLTCLDMFTNCLDVEKHNCTRENVYYCSACNIIMNRKEDMVFHVKQCCTEKEQTLTESENYVEESIVDAIQDNSIVRDGVPVNKVTSKSSKLIKQSKKLNSFSNYKRNYKCELCCKVFKYHSELQNHLRRHTGDKPFVCELCKKSFTLKNNLTRHLQLHNIKQPFICPHCKRSFSRLDNLKLHLRLHSEEKPFVCEYCKKSFISLRDLKRHIKTHTGERPFVCKHCDKSFIELYYLKFHVKIHIGEKSFVCEFCKKSFMYVRDLKRHVQTHTGERPFVCEHCKKSFIKKGDLKRHMRTHTGERPYFCNICKKSFTRPCILKYHIRQHTGEKPFVCEHCKKSFTQLGSLKQHILTHNGEKPFVCEHCKKSFTQLVSLKQHILTHNGEKPFVCEHCNKTYTRSYDLKRHKLKHSGE